MVLIGGVIVDRIGTRTATLVFTVICLAGAILTAISGTFTTMALGRLVFGLGAESMIVAVTAALGQWFKGRQLGFAFGLNLSIARAGSYAADLSPTWARGAYASGWRAADVHRRRVRAGLLRRRRRSTGFSSAARSRATRSAARRRPTESSGPTCGASIRSYWYIVGLCVTFYSVIFPFRSTFAIEYFQNAHGLSLEQAGEMNGYVFLAAIFATPLFGLLVDRSDRRSLAMAVGSLLLLAVFPMLLYTS